MTFILDAFIVVTAEAKERENEADHELLLHASSGTLHFADEPSYLDQVLHLAFCQLSSLLELSKDLVE